MVWNDEVAAPAIAYGDQWIAYDDKESIKTKVGQTIAICKHFSSRILSAKLICNNCEEVDSCVNGHKTVHSSRFPVGPNQKRSICHLQLLRLRFSMKKEQFCKVFMKCSKQVAAWPEVLFPPSKKSGFG